MSCVFNMISTPLFINSLEICFWRITIDMDRKHLYSLDMPVVRNLAVGYYGIETDGVQISVDVNQAIQEAFKTANEIPASNLRVSLADRSASIEAEPSSSKTVNKPVL